MVLIETYITLSIVTIALRIPHFLNGSGDSGVDIGETTDLTTTATTFLTEHDLSAAYLFNSTYVVDSTIREIAKSHVNLAVAVNTIFTVFLLFGKVVQYFFFGKLREIEERNFRERFFLYVVTKFFIFAVKDHELISTLEWGFWFGIQCFLKLFSLLSRDRFEYLNTFSPNTHAKIHFKLLFLLVSILLSDLCCFYISTTRFFNSGLSNILILNFEFFTIFFETIQTLVKYSIHLFDMSHTGVWEMRGQYVYFAEFATDSIILAGTCFHLIHIVIIQGMPTLLDLVLFSYFKGVFTELKRKIIGYRNYCKLVEDMENKYLNATEEELVRYNDDCAICRDKMDTAKKLPCGHIFHQSWLEQQTSCPTCRRSLMELQSDQQEQSLAVNSDAEGIREMFPQIPLEYIITDLSLTNSVQETINNILEERIRAPPPSQSDVSSSPSSSTTTTNINELEDNKNIDNNNNNNSNNENNNNSLNSITNNNNNNNNNNILNSDSTDSKNLNEENNINTCTQSNSSSSNNNNNNIENKDNENTIDSKSSSSSNPTHFSKPADKFADSFKSSPEARQNSLMLRKKMMLEASRRLFLEEMDREDHNKRDNS
ncbi:putative ubiquitin-protein ligase [Heterostelium album PN500]|uniref:Putative ubiquitin-protein ligase n=1 Tax=Heterostelium pallidum (strain ATCC 26659 / Pp 5 / PN500) TaxID=670386 RepID=D3B838_HETP5|nr:putative ubiquitin-protein ligase [Heterostelium album PN500]EFA82206.1 putative ubiquitin-protein ligase [Heterostelium album PN500]|eukprot:XP_020434323.1 putative ubiquitin-protein ligase [Heterostelium album PN500]